MEQHATTKRGRKACTECRQQKVRCNVSIDPHVDCSRCQKMGLECVISDPFKRQHKRQRLSELEKEADFLRQKLATTDHSEYPSPSRSSGNPSPPVAIAPPSVPLVQLPQPTTTTTSSTDLTLGATLNSYQSSVRLPIGISNQPTESRTLDGLRLEADTIDELFRIYFRMFSVHMPILESSLGPNVCFAQSEFLFWAVCYVGARKYPGEPNLLDALHPKVSNLALMSSKAEGKGPCTVKALLLWLTWHPPKRSASMDILFPLSATLLHIAMQIGLHMPISCQDIFRGKTRMTDQEINERAELWAYCIITYQGICNCIGQVPAAMLFTAHDSSYVQVLLRRCSAGVRSQVKISHMLNSCCNALLENGLRIISPDSERAMNIIIRVFEVQLQDAELEASTELDAFYVGLARLNIRAFHFFKDLSTLSPTSIAQLCASACMMIDQVHRLGRGRYPLTSGPMPFLHALMQANNVLLRLLKTPVARYLDTEATKDSLFLGFDMLRQLSVRPMDLPEKQLKVLMLLWDSQNVYRDQSGAPVTNIRVRSRSSCSHVFDNFGWWREEFGDEFERKHNMTLQQTANGDIPATTNGTQQDNSELIQNGMGSMEPSWFLDDQWMAELDWAFGDVSMLLGATDLNGFSAPLVFADAIGPGGS